MGTLRVGDTVHYVSYGTPNGEYVAQCRAAIITEVLEDSDKLGRGEPVSLAVINPTGFFFKDCRHSEGAQTGGTWHYKEHE